jgi:hypothetical protein
MWGDCDRDDGEPFTCLVRIGGKDLKHSVPLIKRDTIWPLVLDLLLENQHGKFKKKLLNSSYLSHTYNDMRTARQMESVVEWD